MPNSEAARKLNASSTYRLLTKEALGMADGQTGDERDYYVARAQVYATLANAAATHALAIITQDKPNA